MRRKAITLGENFGKAVVLSIEPLNIETVTK